MAFTTAIWNIYLTVHNNAKYKNNNLFAHSFWSIYLQGSVRQKKRKKSTSERDREIKMYIRNLSSAHRWSFSDQSSSSMMMMTCQEQHTPLLEPIHPSLYTSNIPRKWSFCFNLSIFFYIYCQTRALGFENDWCCLCARVHTATAEREQHGARNALSSE